MSRYYIDGGIPLKGENIVKGCKNSVLPMMAAALIHKGVSIIENCPDISDVQDMSDILRSLGCVVNYDRGTLTIDASYVDGDYLSGEIVKKVRSSVLVMGAMLARKGCIRMDYPGGCRIGKRPIDYHIDVLRSLGANITEKDDCIEAECQALKGAVIYLPFPSVGATENALIAAAAAQGTTILRGTANEPEIHDLCVMLRKMGADISNFRPGKIIVRGKDSFLSIRHRLMSDRIVAGTYAIMAAACGGSIRLQMDNVYAMTSLSKVLKQMGCIVNTGNDYYEVTKKARLRAVERIVTEPFPGFPTDLQSQIMVALCLADGKSTIEEEIFENRFQVVDELVKQGADISVFGTRAVINGCKRLYGKETTAKELRGGAALITAALAAYGQSIVTDENDYIRRGYENIENDVKGFGGRIYRD